MSDQLCDHGESLNTDPCKVTAKSRLVCPAQEPGNEAQAGLRNALAKFHDVSSTQQGVGVYTLACMRV